MAVFLIKSAEKCLLQQPWTPALHSAEPHFCHGLQHSIFWYQKLKSTRTVLSILSNKHGHVPSYSKKNNYFGRPWGMLQQTCETEHHISNSYREILTRHEKLIKFTWLGGWGGCVSISVHSSLLGKFLHYLSQYQKNAAFKILLSAMFPFPHVVSQTSSVS